MKNHLNKKRLIIIGGGELGRQVCYYINKFRQDVIIEGFVDDTLKSGEIIFNEFFVLGSIADLTNLQFDCLSMAIGYNHLEKRMKIFEENSNKYPFETFIHPNAYVDESAKIGKGAFISAGCVIEKDTVIGDNVFLYNSVIVAHNSVIRSGSFIAPSVTIAGFSEIGECSFAGVGTIISDNISICPHTYLGAGSLVIKNINEPGWYSGRPCKKMNR